MIQLNQHQRQVNYEGQHTATNTSNPHFINPNNATNSNDATVELNTPDSQQNVQAKVISPLGDHNNPHDV